tara:strand:- start:584 stop:754 length:171 start_codon:yes stop_codon:yes gene_type:complete
LGCVTAWGLILKSTMPPIALLWRVQSCGIKALKRLNQPVNGIGVCGAKIIRYLRKN